MTNHWRPHTADQLAHHRAYHREYQRVRRARIRVAEYRPEPRTPEWSKRASRQRGPERVGFCTRCGIGWPTDPCAICLEELLK